MAFAYSFSLTGTKLASLLCGLESDFAQVILEKVTAIRFASVASPPDEFHFSDGFDPQRWERGRGFGEQMELRWRRRGNDFVVLLISESPPSLPAETQEKIGELPKPVKLTRVESDPPQRVVLWGEWQDRNVEPELREPEYQGRHWWYEERIPKFLGYPFAYREEHLAIEVACYRAPPPPCIEQHPSDKIYRFIRLVPFVI